MKDDYMVEVIDLLTRISKALEAGPVTLTPLHDETGTVAVLRTIKTPACVHEFGCDQPPIWCRDHAKEFGHGLPTIDEIHSWLREEFRKTTPPTTRTLAKRILRELGGKPPEEECS